MFKMMILTLKYKVDVKNPGLINFELSTIFYRIFLPIFFTYKNYIFYLSKSIKL